MVERLITLGNGHAHVTTCYNACFAIDDGEDVFLLDAGGGNGILGQLEKCEIPIFRVHSLFVSHSHTDHILGSIWLIRLVAAGMHDNSYQGNFTIYCHEELALIIRDISLRLIQVPYRDYINKRIRIRVVHDGECLTVGKRRVTFFDILSPGVRQYGCHIELKSRKSISYLGDEPLRDHELRYVNETDYLLHEALCGKDDIERLKPHEINHSSVRDACDSGIKCAARNLILIHCDDKIFNRKEVMENEAAELVDIPVYVPDDLDIVDI